MQVLVAGMHRSGTSMVTRLLNLAGLYVGTPEEMMQGMPDNPGGYWERNDICDLNTKALNAAGVDWNTTLGDEFATVGPGRRKEVVHGFRDVIQGLEEHRPWVVKDPRLSVLLPVWTPLLSDPVVVICHRNPLEVARSLRGRDGMPIGVGLALWEVYTLAVLQNTREIPRIFVAHEDLIRSPIETVETMVSQLRNLGSSDIEMPSPTKIKRLINNKLHRSKTTEDQVVDFLVGNQIRLIDSLATGAGLDDWSLENLSESSKDLIVFYREAATAGSERRQQGMEQVRTLFESFGDNRDQLAAEIQKVHEEKAELGVRFEAANLERADLSERLDSMTAESRRLAEEMQTSQSESGGLSGRLVQAHEDMEKLGALLENLNTEKDRLAQELVQVHEEKGAIGLQLETAGAETARLEEKIKILRQERSALDEDFQKSREDRAGLAARLEPLHEEMQRLGTLLEKTNAENVAMGAELRELHGLNQEIGTKLEFATEETRNAVEKARGLEKKSNELVHELTMSREEGIRLSSTLEQAHSKMEVVGALLDKTTDDNRALSAELKETHVAKAELGLRFDQVSRANQEIESELKETHVAKAELGLRFDRVNVASQQIESELDALRNTHAETKASFSEMTNERDEWKTRFETIEALLRESTSEVDGLKAWRRALEEQRTFRMYRRVLSLFGGAEASQPERTTGEEDRHFDDGA